MYLTKLHFSKTFKYSITFIVVTLCVYTTNGQILPFSDQQNSGNWVLNTEISDEFEAATLDEDQWLIQGRNGQYQSNFIGRVPAQFSTDNAILEDGKLKILTKWEPGYPFTKDNSGNQLGEYNGVSKPITTAAVISKKQFQYGYMEIKSKAANAEITSSFWTTGPGPGKPGGASELDMFEMFGGHKSNNTWKKRLKFNIISWDPNNDIYKEQRALGKIGTTHTRNIQAANNTADDFHVYGFEWTAEYIKVYIDGVLHPDGTILKSVITKNGTEPDRWVTDVPYWVWFDSETFPWLGLPEASDLQTPAEYQIEYIRVWQQQPAEISVIGNSDAIEGHTDGVFTVALANAEIATQDINVTYSVGGTATEGADYSSILRTVTIANGTSSAQIIIDAIEDGIDEGLETVTITLKSSSSKTVNTTEASIEVSDFVESTVLTAGDIAILGWKSGSGKLAFMLLKDIAPATKLSISNRTWSNSLNQFTGDYSVDDIWTWTAGAAFSIGDIFILDADGLIKHVVNNIEVIAGATSHDYAGKIAETSDGDFDYSANGEGILIFQADPFALPTDSNSIAWITGVNTAQGWGVGGGNTVSDLPTALTNGVNANDVGEKHDFGVYTGKLSGTPAQLRASINDVNNWVFSEATEYKLWSFDKTSDNISGNIGTAGTLSLSENPTFKLTVFPNPVNDYLYLNFGESQSRFEIEIFTTFGKSVKKVKENNVSTSKIDVSNLSSGVYFLSIISENTKQIKKIIIK
jgi:beta-glucanase (GH16 family)